MVPWGSDGSFISATNLTQAEPVSNGNGIFLYTAQTPNSGSPKWSKTELADNSWNAAVNVMTGYNQVLTDANGNPVPTTYTGSVINAKSLKIVVPVDVDPSSLIGQTIVATTAPGISTAAQITGFIGKDVSGVTYSVNTAIPVATGAIPVTLPDKVTTQPGLLVGLSDGSVYYWNGTVCEGSPCAGPIVNGTPQTVIQNVDSPVSMAIAPNGSIYALGDNLTVIDSATNAITATLPSPGPGPYLRSW